MKCIKCGIYYKDRKDPSEVDVVNESLCFNCNFVWKTIVIMLESLKQYSKFSKVNRIVEINFDDIKITKKKGGRI